MLFNSYAFICAFLPVTLFGVWLLRHNSSNRPTLSWLIACSVAFYGLWNPLSLAIITPSLVINYGLGRLIQRQLAAPQARERAASALLAGGVVFNLCFLGYFKYKNFFLDSLNWGFGTGFELSALLLPLGISFITFQKIAFLVDVRASTIKKFDAFEFLIFVFFFPQLIAGPIVHFREMVPQFNDLKPGLSSQHLAVGLGIFAIGLFKKAILADGVAPHANAIFQAAERGDTPTLIWAWIGAMAYTLQIYFDFSGYSDMAIGLARMVGIRLPANFNSPLKASSIIDFWARWHLTLTRFLTAYIYTPIVMNLTRARMASGKAVLGRNAKSIGAFAVLVAWPTVITMAVSGVWHGAGTTFILWGLLHGVFLCINHAWRLWRPAWDKRQYDRIMSTPGRLLTLIAVIVSMVLFRAKTLAAASAMLAAMTGGHGVALPHAVVNRLGSVGQWLLSIGVGADFSSGASLQSAVLWLTVLGVIALWAPNSLEIMSRFEPALHFRGNLVSRRWQADLRPGWAAAFGLVLAAGVLSLNQISEFLYWQF